MWHDVQKVSGEWIVRNWGMSLEIPLEFFVFEITCKDEWWSYRPPIELDNIWKNLCSQCKTLSLLHLCHTSSSILFTYMLSFWRLSLHYSGLIDVWPSQWPLHPNFIMLSTNTSTQSWNGTSSYSPWEQCNLSTKLILLKRDCRQLPKLEQIPTNEIFDI